MIRVKCVGRVPERDGQKCLAADVSERYAAFSVVFGNYIKLFPRGKLFVDLPCTDEV